MTILSQQPQQRSLQQQSQPQEQEQEHQQQTEGRNEHVKLVQVDGKLYFGPYQLQHTLGEGEFGKVKLGILTQHPRGVNRDVNRDVDVDVEGEEGGKYAIKFVKKSTIMSSENRMLKLQREIDILKRVHTHPNIIRLHRVLESEKYIGLVMEFASGGELFDYILAKRHLSEKEARRFFWQLIDGVQYLHRQNIIHRDLKLENLLLDGRGIIKITDFGFANQSPSSAQDLMSTSCGSPCYAAPELVLADRYIGSAADVWSCGVILYAMICGYLPFDDDPQNPDSTNVNLLYKYILKSPLKFPTWVSHQARDLLRGLLAPDPKQRLTIDQLLQHPWMLQSHHLQQQQNQESSLVTAAVRNRASSAPNPQHQPPPPLSSSDLSVVVTIPKVFSAGNNSGGGVGKLPSPILPFRSRFASTKASFALPSTIVEEQVSPQPPSTASTSPAISYPTLTASTSTSSSVTSLLAAATAANNGSGADLLQKSQQSRTVSNPDSIFSLLFNNPITGSSETTSSLPTAIKDVKDVKGALDPKTISSKQSPIQMLDSVIQSLMQDPLPSSYPSTHRHPVTNVKRGVAADDGYDGDDDSKCLFHGGVLTVIRKSPVVIGCTWVRQDLPKSLLVVHDSRNDVQSLEANLSTLNLSPPPLNSLNSLNSNCNNNNSNNNNVGGMVGGGNGNEGRSGRKSSLKSVATSFMKTLQRKTLPHFRLPSSSSSSSSSNANSVKFTITVCSVPNLSGFYCLDIHRVRGDKWEFKKLYDQIISSIDYNNQ